MVKLAGLAAVFALTIMIGAKREWAETFVRALSYVGGAYAAWAFLSWSSDRDTVFGAARSFGGSRLTGSFLSANSAATLFACQCLLQLCLVLRAVRRAPQPFFSRRAWSEMKGLPPALIFLFLNASCLLLTASRTGAVASVAAAALVIAGFALIRTNERSAAGGVIAIGALLGFGALVLLLASGGALIGRLADNPVADHRLVIFAAYWNSILASPWWGYGLGTFYADNYQAMTVTSAIPMGTLGAAHNLYLQWLLETGVSGFAPMMICIAIILATILAGFRRRSRQQALMVFALATAALFAIHGITDFALEEPSLAAYFTAVLGLGYGVATRA
jgi:O-antigen ligase